MEASITCDMRNKGIEYAGSLEEMGLRALASINYAEGIGQAYGHDDMHAWMMEGAGND